MGASNGQTPGDAYPSPTLHVNPDEIFRIHLENQLVGWSGQVESSNIHTHGLDFSPLSKSDNVLLAIPGGQTNDYLYRIPTNQDGRSGTTLMFMGTWPSRSIAASRASWS